MKWFRSKENRDLIQLLKNSDGDFKFDPNKLKYHLFAAIDQADQKPVRHFKVFRVIKYSAAFAAMVIVLSGAFAFASNSKPGDRLFAINKAGENVILSLPLPAEQKARVQEYIVTQRFEALDKVQESKKLETVRESNESLTKAIERISENKNSLESAGNSKSAEKLVNVLENLENIASQREQFIKDLQARSEDQETKEKYETYLKKIKSSREKAREEIRRFKDSDHSENRGRD